MESGIVTGIEGPVIRVLANGTEVACSLKGRLKRKQLRSTGLVVVGDRVQVERQDVAPTGQPTGSIVSIEQRTSELSRPGFHGYVHVMAANVDQVVIVQATQEPRFKRHLIDRFLVVASRGNMEPVVVVNKCDLADESLVISWVAPIEASGVKVVLTSALTGRGVPELRGILAGRTSVMAGQSGVGKSALVNAMYPGLYIRTGHVSLATNKGRHTTTSSRLYALPDGGYLADTPGIRQLGLTEEDDEYVASAFPEIEQLAAGCRFRDCSHTHEPGCAVKRALDDGRLDKATYASFVRMPGRGH